MNLKKKTKFRLLNKNKNFYRMLIYKTNKHIYVNIYNNFLNKNILSISTLNKNIRKKLLINNIKNNNIKSAKYISEIILEKCLNINLLNNVIVDISGFKYHGKIKIIVEKLKNGNIIYNKKYNKNND
ncbi:50S ribosomal protein L18 [Candidatus Nardonella dryophthoridicola]|uniref:50S ribosomal protein L18 n=1 Tax=endosymbiont of Rhynchophorus ferrugineus TaxID=1972133 RepID=A0A2Z5T3Z0_9GAMM|nr:50S ribosomal protein L18 [Candidatus Nardonella dryophthoridicola]QTJ62861.1 hypothetical protein JRY34_01030 [Candidatus Nardonella dryophthoridicola]BBA85107.1 50S ribosomal protein L18 [endosymbiont of Rhynchophorus ferrugineus]